MGWKRYSSMLTDKISATMFKTNKAKFGLMELGAKEMRAGNAKAYAEKLDLAVTFWQQIINYIQRENCNLIFRNAACYAWGHDMVSMTYAAFLEIAKIQKEKGELPSLEQLSTMPTVNMFPLQHIYNPKVTSTQVRQNFETHYKEEKVDKVYQKAHEDVMRLINAARRERAIAGGARKKSAKPLPRLVLHFDVNKTIIMGDGVQGVDFEEVFKNAVAEAAYGTVTDRKWAWDGEGISTGPAKHGKISFGEHLKKTYNKKTEKSTRKEILRGSTKEGGQLFHLKEEVDKLCDRMKLPERFRGEDATKIGLKKTYYILPSFFRLIQQLTEEGREFSVIFRTFGTDLPEIISEYNAFCTGAHPMYDFKSPGLCVNDKKIGCIRRDEKDVQMYVGDIDISKYDQKTSNQQFRDQFMKKCEHLKNGKAIYEYFMTVTPGKSFACRDHWQFWNNHEEEPEHGKLMLIDPTDMSVHQIFFDDNITGEENAGIVDVRNVQTNETVPSAEAWNQYMVKAEPILATTNEDYYIEMVQLCEKNRKSYIGRQGKMETSMVPQAPTGNSMSHQDWGLANVSRSASSFMKKSVASTRTMSPKINYNGDNAKEVRRFDDESIRTQSIPQDTQWESHPNVSSSPPAKIEYQYGAETGTGGNVFTPRIAEVVRKFKLKKGDMVKTNQSKNMSWGSNTEGIAPRDQGDWGTITDERFTKALTKSGYPKEVGKVRIDWANGNTVDDGLQHEYETNCKITHVKQLLENDSRRRMAQREFSDRRDSPVMVRLLQEIIDAQDD